MPDFATLKPVDTGNSQPDFATLKPFFPEPKSSDTQIAPENTSGASFPANRGEGFFTGIGKLIGNIPSSTFNLLKETAKLPVNAVKSISKIPSEFQHLVQETGGVGNAVGATAKELLPSLYGTLVPKATQQVISGDFEGARQTLTNDPVGQILPYILTGKTAAEKAGMGTQFDSAISKIASPVTKPVATTSSKVGGIAGKLATQALGTATGAGASSIEQAVQHSQAFTDALRGKINPDDVVQTAQNAVQNIADTRRNAYVSSLEKIGQQKGSLDISPVYNSLKTQLNNFGVKVKPDGNLDFTRSSIANNGTARSDIEGVYGTLKEWGSQAGDRTPLGLDTLKKQLGDFYSDSGSARALVQAVKSKVQGVLQEQVPGYLDMTKTYSQATQLLDDIKSATGIGGKSKIDTIFTKLTTALKGDKELRLEILKQVEANGAQPDLMAKIAGINMQSLIPKGLVGKGIDVSAAFGLLTHFFNPQVIPMLLSTSPRIVGEFVRALGIGAEKTKTVLDVINKLPEKVPALVKNYNENPKLGLSIENVAKNITMAEKGTLRDFTDYVNGSYKPTGQALVNLKRDAQEIADKYGFSSAQKGDRALSSQFGQYLDSVNYSKKIMH